MAASKGKRHRDYIGGRRPENDFYSRVIRTAGPCGLLTCRQSQLLARWWQLLRLAVHCTLTDSSVLDVARTAEKRLGGGAARPARQPRVYTHAHTANRSRNVVLDSASFSISNAFAKSHAHRGPYGYWWGDAREGYWWLPVDRLRRIIRAEL